MYISVYYMHMMMVMVIVMMMIMMMFQRQRCRMYQCFYGLRIAGVPLHFCLTSVSPPLIRSNCWQHLDAGYC